MTEPYMAATTELLPHSQQAVSHPWRHTCGSTLQRRVLVFILFTFCASMLTGCKDFWDKTADLFRIDGGGGGDAAAQEPTEVRVKTYTINPEEFEVVLDNEIDPTPTYQVHDSATELTMQSAGTLVGVMGGVATIDLDIGDVLILRLDGTNGTVTLIRKD